MTSILDLDPYGPRMQKQFLAEVNELTHHHINGCEPYRRINKNFVDATKVEDIPWVHVGVFKHLKFRTEAEGIVFGERTLNSSATSSGIPSQIVLDNKSSDLQSKSSISILKKVVGDSLRPLLILDSSRSLRGRTLSARVAAAMSLKPLASEIYFLLDDATNPDSMKWDVLTEILERENELLVYGFTWILWLAWANGNMPEKIKSLLKGKTIHFVHSGGWKKLESQKVSHREFDSLLLNNLTNQSKVIDFYGLVEQIGVIFPLTEDDYRLVPVWSECIVRDPWTLEPIYDKPGMLQLINLLSWGAPYHSVLTEDMAIMPRPKVNGLRKFKLLGRIPKAEVRGCANV